MHVTCLKCLLSIYYYKQFLCTIPYSYAVFLFTLLHFHEVLFYIAFCHEINSSVCNLPSFHSRGPDLRVVRLWRGGGGLMQSTFERLLSLTIFWLQQFIPISVIN
jgi:hypothetical protein